MPKTDLTFTGGEYAPVADRVRLFYQQYPTGRIVTHLVRRTEAEVVFRTTPCVIAETHTSRARSSRPASNRSDSARFPR